MQSYILLFVAIITTVLSQLLFKQGMLMTGSLNLTFSNIGLLLVSIIKNHYLLFGVFFYGVSFILWLLVLSKMKLSIAYPITSLNFVLAIIASYYLFGERISQTQYAGIAFIIIGVVVLSKG